MAKTPHLAGITVQDRPVTRDPGYAVALRGELRALLDDPSSPVFDLVDVAAVRRVADATRRRGAGDRVRWARRGIERVLALHNWLREYEPAVVT